MTETEKPTSFQLVLERDNQESFKNLIDYLVSVGVHGFSWECYFDGMKQKYRLTIDSSWAYTIVDLAKLLPDYVEDEEEE